jgi:predicted nucleic acid-binding protein
VILLDTNVISETTRRVPSAHVLAFLSRHPVAALSSVSVMELEAGVQGAPPAKRARLTTWLEELLSSGAVEVIPMDVAIARAAGRLRAQTRHRTIPTEDLLIGATALSRGSTLATRNTKHFESMGIALVNPFEPARQR